VRKAKLISLILCAAAVLSACDKREDLPTQLNLTPPPKPFNLSVTHPSSTQYDLTWDISDPGLVKEYYVYIYTGLAAPDSIGASPNTSFTWNTPFEVTGFAFGVTAVTNQNVESDPEIEPVP
jgi:hypothetical protein